MTSYAFEVKQCTKCGSQFTISSVRSCNTFGATYYTDGFICGPMFTHQSALLSCPSCREFLWRDELPTIESTTDYDYYRASLRKSMPDALGMGLLIYEDAIKARIWRTEEQERYIRIRLWWLYNSDYYKVRHRPWWLLIRERGEQHNEEFVLSSEQEENLRRLLTLTDSPDPDMLIMRAEIFRELGEFGKCVEVLNKITDDRLQVAVDVIMRLARSGERRVEIVNAGQ